MRTGFNGYHAHICVRTRKPAWFVYLSEQQEKGNIRQVMFTFRCGSGQYEVIVSLLHHLHFEQRPALLLLHTAHVPTASERAERGVTQGHVTPGFIEPSIDQSIDQ